VPLEQDAIGDKLIRGIAEIKSRKKERRFKPGFLVLFSTIKELFFEKKK
jgi:hypothetical protein